MTTTEGTFRVYRVLDAVAHLNLLDTDERRLYTVFESGYPDRLQETIDGLATGDLVTGTVTGEPNEPDEPWRLRDVERQPQRSVSIDFATGVRYPDVARETWSAAVEAAGDGPVRPTGRALGHDGTPAGEVWIQPRSALPDGAFTLPALAGRLPLEPLLRDLPYAGGRPGELLVVDADGPGAATTEPYGVLLFFTPEGRALADRYRERWGLPRGADSRPSFDPY